jgi:hypothetical protein
VVLAIAVGAVRRALPARVPGKGIRPKNEGEGRPFSVKLPELPNLTRLKGKKEMDGGEGGFPGFRNQSFLASFGSECGRD